MQQRMGVVLAGGAGRRMGRTKGDLDVDGRALAVRAAEVLWPLCVGVLVSIRPGTVNPAPEYPSVEDSPPAGRGPLAGLDAAFRASGESDLLVLACDYPNVTSKLLERLIGCATPEDELVMATDARGRDHPLIGLWRRTTAARVSRALAEGAYKVRSLLVELEVRRVGPAELTDFDLDRAMLNLNWPADLERLDG